MEPVIYDMDSEEPSSLVLPRARRRLLDGGLLTNTVKPGALPSAVERYRKRASDLYDEGSKLMDSEPDMSQLQAFARQQGEQGNAAMLNALAAQYAGESFQPIQAQYLKRAAAAQEPMKVGGGMLTPDGQFIKDPMAARDKRAEFLLQQAKAYETLAQTAQTAQERAEATRQQQQFMNELRTMGMNIQQQGLDLRRDALNSKKGDDTKNWRNEDNLRGDFDKLTKDLRDQIQSTGNITQIINATPPGQKPDAITQQSLVILLNKFLDPGSVVREGEFDRVVKAQGLEGRVMNLRDRILKGQPLDTNTINQINGLAQLYNQAATSKMQAIANNYIDIANRRGLNVESVISDPNFRGGNRPAPASAAAPLTAAEKAELARLRQQFGGTQ